MFSFENIYVWKNVNHLLQKYDLFIQEYAKAAPTRDELKKLNALGGSSLKK